MEIKILHRQGQGIRAMARTLGVSRNTVRKALRQAEEKLGYQARPRRASKLDPYAAYLQERVAAAQPQWLPATVLYREIRAQGYTGQVSILRAFLRTLKPSGVEALWRFETPPGQQMQVDWAVFGRAPQRLSAFVATLGYSRAAYVEFVTDERLETLLHCHAQAFHAFGGVPQQVLYDNMKTVVLQRDYYSQGQHRFQPGLWDFAHHYGFVPKLCRPYRAQTKGKVERFIHYLRYSFYLPLVSRLQQAGLRLDVLTANVEVQRWLRDVAKARVHATLQQIPTQRLQQERCALQPLPLPYCGQRPGLAQPLAAAAPLPRSLLATAPPTLQHPLSQYEALLSQEGP